MTRPNFLCAVLFSLSVVSYAPVLHGQDAPPANQQQQDAPSVPLAPEQLDSLVAPIALYPDSLLSQVLVASTYPLEIVEADRWLQQSGANLQGSARIEAAQQQNWDPSIQALVAFPDVIKRLDSDIRWTTDLGNAFLASQASVMDAVQRMRAKARDSGKLLDTPQQNVVVQNDGGQSAIEIQPTDPQVIYVPVYNPEYFWGAPSPYYPWPGLYYPGIGVGWGWGFGIHIGGFFGGCCGWGGWGWGPGWFNHTVIVNNSFIHRYNFRDFHGDGQFRGSSVWAHDSGHRLGVPYPNRGVANRFQGSGGNNRGDLRGGGDRFNRSGSGFNSGSSGRQPETRQSAPPARQFNNSQFEQRNNNHSAFGGAENGGRAREQSDHGFSSMGPQRTAPAFHGGGAGGGGGSPRMSAPRPSGGGGGHSGGRGR